MTRQFFHDTTSRHAVFCVSCALGLSLFQGCDVREKELRQSATKQLEGVYLVAATDFARDCGITNLFSDKIPACLFTNPNLDTWNGPYLKGATNGWDAFGNPFVFRRQEGVIEIISAGNDGKIGTKDDIILKADLEK